MKDILSYAPVYGKTYSLFGGSDHTNGYYSITKKMVLECLEKVDESSELFHVIRSSVSRKNRLKKIAEGSADGTLLSYILHRAGELFYGYTLAADDHLKELSFKQIWDRRLGTTREQYYLHMIEIALVNHLNKQKFLLCDQKIALLPYCLQDFSAPCKASQVDFDYQCKHCSKNCYGNHISRILEKHGIEPYIWTESDFKVLNKKLKNRGKKLGVMGIACLPELAWGIHQCAKLGIPVIGIPLDGNCCIRWWGEFHSNSVNLVELEKLVTGDS